MATTVEEVGYFQSREDLAVEAIPGLACDAIKKYVVAKNEAELAELHAKARNDNAEIAKALAEEAIERAKMFANMAHELMEKSEVLIEIDCSSADAYIIQGNDINLNYKTIDVNPKKFEADQVYPSRYSLDLYNSQTITWLRVLDGEIEARPAA